MPSASLAHSQLGRCYNVKCRFRRFDTFFFFDSKRVQRIQQLSNAEEENRKYAKSQTPTQCLRMAMNRR